MARRVRWGYKVWITLFAALIGSVPLISLIQKLFNIGLSPILFEALSSYRKIVYPWVEGLQYVLSYVPWLDLYTLVYSKVISHDIYKDLTALSFMSAMALNRVITQKFLTEEIPRQGGVESAGDCVMVGVFLVILFFVCFVLGLTLLAVVIPFTNLYNAIRARKSSEDIYVMYLTSLVIAFVAAGVLFAINELIK